MKLGMELYLLIFKIKEKEWRGVLLRDVAEFGWRLSFSNK
jgi:hypothetical protein